MEKNLGVRAQVDTPRAPGGGGGQRASGSGLTEEARSSIPIIGQDNPVIPVAAEVDTDIQMGEAREVRKRQPEEAQGTAKRTKTEEMRMEVDALVEKFGGRGTDIAEVYSPARVQTHGERFGLTRGMALDLSTYDEKGVCWDFSKAERRATARRRVAEEKPILLIGSPMCRVFSALRTLSNNKRDPEVVKREYTQAMVHLNFCVELYRDQLAAGRYFLHEHPDRAKSWKTEQIEELSKVPGVMRLVGHMCTHGMKSRDKQGVGLVLKPTGWLTNCEGIAEEVAAKCKNIVGKERHRHVELTGGRAKECEVYPDALCVAILRGLHKQLVRDGRMEKRGQGVLCQEPELNRLEEHPHDDAVPEVVYDDVSGALLDPERVREARQVEFEFIDRKPLYDEVPVEEAMRVTGKRPTSTRFADVDKGFEYRSRWVARDFRNTVTDEFFAATPPWEAIKTLFALAASQGMPRERRKDWWRKEGAKSGEESERQSRSKGVRPDEHWVYKRQGYQPKDRLKLDFIDIKRAHFNPVPKEPTYVELPPGRRRPGYCARLRFNLYGSRGAAQAWEEHYGDKLMAKGFVRGRSNPCLFHHPQKEILTVVHGDDFTSLGTDSALDWLKAVLEEEYELKHGGRISPDAGDQHEARVLNRVVTWDERGLRMEADQRHVEIALKCLGLEGCREVSSPGVDVRPEEEKDDEIELGAEDAKVYRSVTARTNYLSMDRPELQYSVKEACRSMAKPTMGGLRKLKRTLRFLKGSPRLIQWFEPCGPQDFVKVTVDSDWAGCRTTRKSTSGGVARWGSSTLKTWATTQAIIALSSGEAEYYAMLKGACLGLGIYSLLEDFGMSVKVRLETDSAAAKGISGRKGVGKVRHIEICYLWLQERVRAKDIEVVKIPGNTNEADLMTKNLDGNRMNELLRALGFVRESGRHELTPPAAC